MLHKRRNINQISFGRGDTMRFTYIDEGGGSGPVTGINRDAEGSETQGECAIQILTHGIDFEFYDCVGGVIVPKELSVVNGIIAQREADALAEDERVVEIDLARGTSGLRQYTMEQVDTYLDARFAAMTDLDSVKTEMRKIIDKMVPYLLG